MASPICDILGVDDDIAFVGERRGHGVRQVLVQQQSHADSGSGR